MGNLVFIWVSRLEECFHTRGWQRDCIMCVFSRVSLEATRQGERHVTPGAGKGLKGFLVLLFLARLGEILVILGAWKRPVSCVVLLMSLQASRCRERHVT